MHANTDYVSFFLPLPDQVRRESWSGDDSRKTKNDTRKREKETRQLEERK